MTHVIKKKKFVRRLRYLSGNEFATFAKYEREPDERVYSERWYDIHTYKLYTLYI